MTLALRYGARTDVGLRRTLNEDSMYAGPRLLAIADGMGGHAAGEVASRVAIETVAPLDQDQPGADLITGLRDAVETASGYLRDMVAADTALDGMGTTLTAVLFAGHRLGLVHIGDSRAYLLREGQLSQITHDHTLVQTLIDEGRISADEATVHPMRSMITKSLTGRGELELDLSIREVRDGDRYLLCSDGLSGVVSEQTLLDTLGSGTPQEACNRLVDLALRAGGPDNISCIVADVVDQPDGTASAPAEPILGGAVTDAHEAGARADTPAGRAAEAVSVGTGTEGTGRRRPTARPRRQRRRISRLGLVLGSVVIVVVAGVVASWVYIRGQYYVGVAAARGVPATVGVFRGVSGSVLGVDLAQLSARTNLPVAALPDDEQLHVRNGIDARDKGDADRIVRQLRSDACHLVVAANPPLPPPSAKPKAKRAAPAPAPTPKMPSYCQGVTR